MSMMLATGIAVGCVVGGMGVFGAGMGVAVIADMISTVMRGV